MTGAIGIPGLLFAIIAKNYGYGIGLNCRNRAVNANLISNDGS